MAPSLKMAEVMEQEWSFILSGNVGFSFLAILCVTCISATGLGGGIVRVDRRRERIEMRSFSHIQAFSHIHRFI